MPQHHLNDDHLSQAEKDLINRNWEEIMRVLNGKSRNLSPEERQRYGSISEQNKLVVLKTIEYDTNQPQLNTPQVDYVELRADWDDRMFFAGFVSRMVEATNICNNIRITHDWDAYKGAQTDYDYTKFMMDQDSGAGFESKYNDLKPFFTTNDGGGNGGNTGGAAS